MTSLIVLLCVALALILLVQVGKVTDLITDVRGEKETMRDNSKWNGMLWLVFMVVFLVGTIWSAWHYRNVMFGYGPHKSASEHGFELDSMFNVTLFFCGIVFVLTHIALCWFAWQYRWKEGRKAKFISHDNRLEIWWTAIPAVVMTILVVRGLNGWNAVMADITPGEDNMEIEAMAQQFGWTIRYPGPDGKLGARDYRLSKDANSLLGMDFTDPKGWDDIVTSAVGEPIMLAKDKKIRVRIIAKDVLHNFDLPHFRVKMDAVPGMPTYFVFKPIKTTTEYRNELRKYEEFQTLNDPKDPASGKRWETFEYELACAELCGKGHYSMRRILKIVSPEEFDVWYGQQKSYYLTEIRGKKGDPNIGKVLDMEVKMRAAEFKATMSKAVTSENEADKTIALNHINFETGSATLTADSKYELDNLVDALTQYPTMVIEVAGHTDNVGDAASNKTLSSQRASSVANYLIGKGVSAGRLRPIGYGQDKPLVENDSPENMAKNRRTEFKILSK